MSARTPARRRGACGCSGRRGRSSSRSSCFTTGNRSSFRNGIPILSRGMTVSGGWADAPDERFANAQLMIADGHHRYETALAFHEEDGTDGGAWMMVVLVSTREEGLTIFPPPRVAQSADGAR